ncbi:MAG: hypothetical protein MUC60_04250 [Oscillatoria sp. Prado101]|nr:hypothetical protein [Oscillatoria sp. Prado101]
MQTNVVNIGAVPGAGQAGRLCCVYLIKGVGQARAPVPKLALSLAQDRRPACPRAI